MTDEVSGELRLFNGAAARNKSVILTELQRLLPAEARILEIGSGSGQHAIHFARAMQGWHWQSSDCEPYIEALRENIAAYPAANLPQPLYLNVAQFPSGLSADVIYAANVVHIMAERLIEPFVTSVAASLSEPGYLLLYGPYKYNGKFTTPSNEQFDLWLKSRDPDSGIRDIERVQALAGAQGLRLVEDVNMPANNQLLVFTLAQSSA